MMSLKEFYSMLEAHDWFWYMADDRQPYKEGEDKESQLIALSQESPQHAELFKSYRNYVFSGPAWGKDNKEEQKPQLPKEAE